MAKLSCLSYTWKQNNNEEKDADFYANQQNKWAWPWLHCHGNRLYPRLERKFSHTGLRVRLTTWWRVRWYGWMMGKPRGVTHSTVWPDLEMSLALSVSQSCNRQMTLSIYSSDLIKRCKQRLFILRACLCPCLFVCTCRWECSQVLILFKHLEEQSENRNFQQSHHKQMIYAFKLCCQQLLPWNRWGAVAYSKNCNSAICVSVWHSLCPRMEDLLMSHKCLLTRTRT